MVHPLVRKPWTCALPGTRLGKGEAASVPKAGGFALCSRRSLRPAVLCVSQVIAGLSPLSSSGGSQSDWPRGLEIHTLGWFTQRLVVLDTTSAWADVLYRGSIA